MNMNFQDNSKGRDNNKLEYLSSIMTLLQSHTKEIFVLQKA